MKEKMRNACRILNRKGRLYIHGTASKRIALHCIGWRFKDQPGVDGGMDETL